MEMYDSATFQGENMVFLVGAPRSGTTWLQRLLATHPVVKTGQESHLFGAYLGPMIRSWDHEVQRFEANAGGPRGGVGIGCYFEEDDVMELARAFVVRMLEVAGVEPGDIFVEKTPRHALFLPEIARVLPGCRVIHLLRDPRDVISSLLAASDSWGSQWAPSSALEAARLWKRYLYNVRKAEAALGPTRFMEVRYEDLSAQPEQELQRIATFAGVEWSAEDISATVECNGKASARRGEATPIPVFGVFGRRFGETVKEPEGFVRDKSVRRRDGFSLKDSLLLRLSLTDAMRAEGYEWSSTDRSSNT